MKIKRITYHRLNKRNLKEFRISYQSDYNYESLKYYNYYLNITGFSPYF